MNSTIKINGKEINKIGIGTWLMGGGWSAEFSMTYADYDNDEKSIRAIRYSIDKGQNHIDTAQMYGAEHCEEIVGEAVKGYDREKLFIASKVWKSHSKRSAVVHQVENMLNRMQLDYLDMIYIHSPRNPFPMEESILGLNDIVDAGLAKGLAVSNFNLNELKEAQSISKHHILANQVLYNIIERSDVNKEMLEFCVSNNIVLVAYRPVERKLLADKCEIQEVLDIAKKHGKTPAQVALNWLVSQENVVAIPKAEDTGHIDENLASLDFEMTGQEMQLLSTVVKR